MGLAESLARRNRPPYVWFPYRPVNGFGVDGDRVYVVGSKGGGPSDPAWFHNLRAHPSVTVELGRGSYQAQAVIARGADRDRLYGLIAAQVPAFGEYEKTTDRTFPVVVLEGVPVPA